MLEQAILDAAWAELADQGWAGFTIGGVAERCGTAKAVIYRRWGNRVQLAQEMLARAVLAEEHAFASSGDLRTDLVRFLKAMQEFLSGPFGEAVRGVLAERADRASTLDGPVPVAVTSVIDAAVDRGDLPVPPPTLVQNLGHTLVIAELVHTAAPPSTSTIENLVDAVWLPALRHGARHGSFAADA